MFVVIDFVVAVDIVAVVCCFIVASTEMTTIAFVIRHTLVVPCNLRNQKEMPRNISDRDKSNNYVCLFDRLL